jgi:hypothetical protein
LSSISLGAVVEKDVISTEDNNNINNFNVPPEKRKLKKNATRKKTEKMTTNFVL